LRERREELGYDLDAIGEALRISPSIRRARTGPAQDLPGPTYAIGFVRAYAHASRPRCRPLLDSYKAECPKCMPDRTCRSRAPRCAQPAGGPILLVGVILAACGYGTWYYLATASAAAPSVSPGAGGAAAGGAKHGADTPPGGPPAAQKSAAVPAPGVATPSTDTRFASGLLPLPASAPAPAVPAVGAPNPASSEPGQRRHCLRPQPPCRRQAASSRCRHRCAGGRCRRQAGGQPTGQIDIRALADCWIRVRSGEDQSVVFAGC